MTRHMFVWNVKPDRPDGGPWIAGKTHEGSVVHQHAEHAAARLTFPSSAARASHIPQITTLPASLEEQLSEAS